MTHKLASAAPRTARAATAAAPTALINAPEPSSDAIAAEEADLFVVELAAAQVAPPNPTPAVAEVAPPPFDLEDEEPPFDAPDEDDEIFQSRRTLELDAGAAIGEESEVDACPAPGLAAAPHAPAINIHVSWERPAARAMLAVFAADPRLARTEITEDEGGIDAACRHFSREASPDLLIIDTTLAPACLIEQLDGLLPRLDAKTRIMVIGEANDVGLLRDLARRGVAHYLLEPRPGDVIGQICELFAERDNAHVIAVVGARGGVGASTIAQNIAWSIAERQGAPTALVDLDLSFGIAGFDLEEKGVQSMGVGFLAPDIVDDAFLDRAAVKQTEKLSVFAAPPSVAQPFDLEAEAVARVLARVRRTAQHVVVDVPHHWAPWIKAVLSEADEVLVVATPDLASLRNAKNLVETLKERRAGRAEPLLLLSMAGLAKGAEISAKDFTEAIGAKPVETLLFDPGLFGMAAIKGKSIGQMAPRSQAGLALDALAWVLTGRPAARAKPKRVLQRASGSNLNAATMKTAPAALAAQIPCAVQQAARAVDETASSLPKRQAPSHRRSYASAQRPSRPHLHKGGGIRAAMAVVFVAAACAASMHNPVMLHMLGQAAGVLN
jgi:pilus assembly protein CpaE